MSELFDMKEFKEISQQMYSNLGLLIKNTGILADRIRDKSDELIKSLDTTSKWQRRHSVVIVVATVVLAVATIVNLIINIIIKN